MQNPLADRIKKKNHSAFTLVELIVVITILVILGTIAFISLGGYAASARDSARIENLSNLHKGLSILQIKSGTYPMPESPVSITASGTVIGYQGFAKELVGALANISKGGTVDPADPGMYTTYAVNGNQTKMQLMTFLEDRNNVVSYIPVLFASATSDYSKRTPLSKWDSLGVLLWNTGSTLNQPVQESGTGIDIINATGSYTMYVSKTQQFSGTWTVLRAGIVGDSLIGYWNFDEGSGLTALDRSGNGNNGALSGAVLPSWTGGKLGSALSFQNNFVLTNPNFWDKIGAMTINLWIFARTSFLASTFISKDNGPGDTIDKRSWYFALGGAGSGFADGFKTALWTGDNHDRKDIVSPSLELSKWNNVSFVYDGQTMKLCLNGTCSDRLAHNGVISNSNNIPVRIGMINDNYFFDGLIDEVRIYNRALSDTEIQSLYNSTK